MELFDRLARSFVLCSMKVAYKGAEEFDDSEVIPECPISKVCQHQIQSKDKPCIVRQKGMVCQSALKYAEVPETDLRWADCFYDI